MVTLDPESLRPVHANSLFEQEIGLLYKFANSAFTSSDDDDNERLQQAIRSVQREEISPVRKRVRNVEITTVAGESGFPIRKYFDWFISCTDDAIVLLGDPCTEQDMEQRMKDAELIDFFQNAPIALHWLSGEGKVIWANQTELNVLGYTAEEYIGQDIMKFCPDEKELVLAIFQQLGSGNAIRDVPVRFRTKDGKIVHLLIDSNVRYEKDGSFGHTRCFIRDDTGRKIRESKAQLLLEETRRSMQMLDNFMARSLHQLRTPLHVTQNMVDTIAHYFKHHAVIASPQTDECMEMVRMANEQITESVHYLDDVADLAKFDQGAVLHTHPQLVELEAWGKEVLAAVPPTGDDVDVFLELCQGDLGVGQGPAMAVVDTNVLYRVIMELVKNAVGVTTSGSVSIGMGYVGHRLTFQVSDTGPGLERQENAAEGDLPTIFQRYHSEFIPGTTADLTIVASARDKIVASLKTHKKSSIGIGLSLTYHLVQALGGELRYHANKGGGTIFQFSLPSSASFNTSVPTILKLRQAKIKREKLRAPEYVVGDASANCNDDTASETADSTMSTLTGGATTDTDRGVKRSRTDCVPTSFEIPRDILPTVPASILAAYGVKSQEPPSILVVEDTKVCAKMLCHILSRFKCATKWVENGQLAVDTLRDCTPGSFDLVLMDIRMPVMDGLEATRIIKRDLGLTVPVVALTGENNDATRKEAETIGFDAFYTKPMKRDALISVIHQFTGYHVK